MLPPLITATVRPAGSSCRRCSTAAGATDPDLMNWQVSPVLPNWPDEDVIYYRWGAAVLPPLTRYYDFPPNVEVRVYVAQYDQDGRYSEGSNQITVCWPETRTFP